MDTSKFKKEFTDSKFWNKMLTVAEKAGLKVLYSALLLYYLIRDENVPLKTKAIILGALGYFIFPIDAIFDSIPIIGFADDLAVMLYAISIVTEYITPVIKEKAKTQLKDWFKTIDDADLQDIESKIDNAKQGS